MNIAIAELVLKFLKGLGLLKDPEQEERERQNLRVALSAFWTSTSSPLYAIPRVLIAFGALWDIFANDSQRWARAVQNLSAQGWAGFIELLPILWLYAGPEALELLRDVYKSRSGSNRQPTVSEPRITVRLPSAPSGGRVDEPNADHPDPHNS